MFGAAFCGGTPALPWSLSPACCPRRALEQQTWLARDSHCSPPLKSGAGEHRVTEFRLLTPLLGNGAAALKRGISLPPPLWRIYPHISPCCVPASRFCVKRDFWTDESWHKLLGAPTYLHQQGTEVHTRAQQAAAG